MITKPEVVEPLQAVLAAEHAVVFGYGVVGAHLRGPDQRRAAEELARHRRQRDALTALLVELGAQPAQSAPAYRLPHQVTTADDARALAALLEDRLAAVWADAVTTSPRDLRRPAVEGLRDAAVAAARWRGSSVPFPGLTERAPAVDVP